MVELSYNVQQSFSILNGDDFIEITANGIEGLVADFRATPAKELVRWFRRQRFTQTYAINSG